MSGSNIPEFQIAVAAHKPYRMPIDGCYIPIHVGAALNSDVCEEMQQDNVGENISGKNGTYSELTAMYWLWKNSAANYKGLVHYRRHFGGSSVRHFAGDPFERVACQGDFEKVFKETDAQVILPKARNYVIETIGDHYRHTHSAEHLDAMTDVLANRCPEYLASFQAELNGTKAHMFNMLVAESSVFDDYCTWLFPLLFELEGQLGYKSCDSFAARYPGRISELLLDVWLTTNDISWTELPVVSPEPVDWVAKGKGFLAAKFFGRKYERSF